MSGETPEAGQEKLEEQVRVALELGIRDVADIRSLLESTTAEEMRARVLAQLDRVGDFITQSKSVLATLIELREQLGTMQMRWLTTQKALLSRIEVLAAEATPTEIAQLCGAYLDLPRPRDDD